MLSSNLQKHHAAALKVGKCPVPVRSCRPPLHVSDCVGKNAASPLDMCNPPFLTPLYDVQDVANLLADKADIAISTDIDFGLHQLHVSDIDRSAAKPASSSSEGRILAKLPSLLRHWDCFFGYSACCR